VRFRLHRSTFLRPRERLYELLALHEADTPSGVAWDRRVGTVLDRRTLAGYMEALVERGLLESVPDAGGDCLRLTEAGRRRLRYLLVDYVRELHQLFESAHDLLRRSLAELALRGARRVAFYPASETAEVAAALLQPLGMELIAVVDDAPDRWGTSFLGVRVQPPAVLCDVRPDAIVIATAVFQDAIVERVRHLGLGDTPVHVL
jgi:hypothetical protein